MVGHLLEKLDVIRIGFERFPASRTSSSDTQEIEISFNPRRTRDHVIAVCILLSTTYPCKAPSESEKNISRRRVDRWKFMVTSACYSAQRPFLIERFVSMR